MRLRRCRQLGLQKFQTRCQFALSPERFGQRTNQIRMLRPQTDCHWRQWLIHRLTKRDRQIVLGLKRPHQRSTNLEPVLIDHCFQTRCLTARRRSPEPIIRSSSCSKRKSQSTFSDCLRGIFEKRMSLPPSQFETKKHQSKRVNQFC